MLLHYLRAEDFGVARAASRLRATLDFRREYRCCDFYLPGAGRQLMMHASNPGAAVYFGDCGIRDCEGEPVLVGRVSLMVAEQHLKPSDRMLPASHLRAAIFVLERAAISAERHASYILDVGDYPAAEMARHGGARYWDGDGVPSGAPRAEDAPGPHLLEHLALTGGLPVLREAMRIASAHYPELLHRVWFYRPGLIFRSVYAIFSLWVPRATRDKFRLVRRGEEHRHFLAPGGVAPSAAPPEMGGAGASLDGDRFLQRAVSLYDAAGAVPRRHEGPRRAPGPGR